MSLPVIADLIPEAPDLIVVSELDVDCENESSNHRREHLERRWRGQVPTGRPGFLQRPQTAGTTSRSGSVAATNLRARDRKYSPPAVSRLPRKRHPE